MDDSLMQQHLVHYKQATESAREELAALQTKHQSLHSQVSIFYICGCSIKDFVTGGFGAGPQGGDG